MPLSPHDDRRRSPRVEILGRLQGHVVSLGIPVKVREISLGGLSFEAGTRFKIGAVHTFSLTLGDESAVELSGRVMYSRDGVGMDGSPAIVTGIQFTDDEPVADEPGIVGEIIDKIQRD